MSPEQLSTLVAMAILTTIAKCETVISLESDTWYQGDSDALIFTLLSDRDITGVSFTVNYDPTDFEFRSDDTGIYGGQNGDYTGWSYTLTYPEEGKVRIETSGNGVYGDGGRFFVLGIIPRAPGGSEVVIGLSNLSVNDGQETARVEIGQIFIHEQIVIEGHVTWRSTGDWRDPNAEILVQAISGMNAGLSGNINGMGQYNLSTISQYDYIQPRLTIGQLKGCSPFDAALIYQHLSGAIELTEEQLVVADIDLDTEVTELDAMLILQKTHDHYEANPYFQDSLRAFPDKRQFPSENGTYTGQDFSLAVLGDVSESFLRDDIAPINGAYAISTVKDSVTGETKVSLWLDTQGAKIYSMKAELLGNGAATSEFQFEGNPFAFQRNGIGRRFSLVYPEGKTGVFLVGSLTLPPQAMGSYSVTIYSVNEASSNFNEAELFGELDRDGDGLLDGDEVNIYGSDPTRKDSDGDGRNDFNEVSLGSDPADPDSFFQTRILEYTQSRLAIEVSGTRGKSLQLQFASSLEGPWENYGTPIGVNDVFEFWISPPPFEFGETFFIRFQPYQ